MLGKTFVAGTVWRGVGLAVALGAGTGCAELFDLDWDKFRGIGADGSGGGATACEPAGDSVVDAPSCAGGMNQSCGPGTEAGSESCCDSPIVPCGNDAACGEIGVFRLDSFEVTVGRFKVFFDEVVAETDKSPLASALMSCGSTYVGSDLNLPVNCVTWAEADAFCRWDGGRLPTIGEFRRAAHADGQVFPWGNSDVDEFKASVATLGGDGVMTRPGRREGGVSSFGQYDLVGNVQEWTRFDGTCKGNPSDPTSQATFGGSIKTLGTSINDSQMIPDFPEDPAVRKPENGFRCARSVTP